MTEKEVIQGMLEGKIYTHPDWYDVDYIQYDPNHSARFIITKEGERKSTLPLFPLWWERMPWEELVEYTSPIPDKTPVWCWADYWTTRKDIGFWDAKSKRPFNFDGERRGFFGYDHVEPIDLDRQSEEFRTMIAEMQIHLED